MKVSWQTPAKEGRRKVAACIRKEFGTKRVKNFKQEVDDMVHMLMRTPNIGKLDPLFEDRPQAIWSIASKMTSSTSLAFGTPAWMTRIRLYK